MVIACELSTPAAKAGEGAPAVIPPAGVVVKFTEPVKAVTVLLKVSCAVTFTLKGVPANWSGMFPPAAASTRKWCSGAVPAEAVKVTGVMAGNAGVEATTVLLFVPDTVPRVQLASVAMPDALVLMVTESAGPVPSFTLPAPVATLNFTPTPETGLLCASVTFTDGGAVTVEPAVSLCGLADTMVRVVGAPGWAVAEKPTLAGPVAEATTESSPAVFPSVQLATVATPEALVLMVTAE